MRTLARFMDNEADEYSQIMGIFVAKVRCETVGMEFGTDKPSRDLSCPLHVWEMVKIMQIPRNTHAESEVLLDS